MGFRIYQLTFFFGLFPWMLSAQSAGSDKVLKDQIIPSIEARLEQPGGDTAHYFILQQGGFIVVMTITVNTKPTTKS